MFGRHYYMTSLGVISMISSNMDNSALGNNKNYLPLLSNIITEKKPVLLLLLLLLSNDGLFRAEYWSLSVITLLYKYDSPYGKFHK